MPVSIASVGFAVCRTTCRIATRSVSKNAIEKIPGFLRFNRRPLRRARRIAGWHLRWLDHPLPRLAYQCDMWSADEFEVHGHLLNILPATMTFLSAVLSGRPIEMTS
jgi:hypothetical protein